MRYSRGLRHLDDQVLAVLRDFPAETTRFVTVVLYGLPRHYLYSTVGNRPNRELAGILDLIEGRVLSLRRRGFVETTGKSGRDRRQNAYGLTARALRFTTRIEDLPPLDVRGREGNRNA